MGDFLSTKNSRKIFKIVGNTWRRLFCPLLIITINLKQAVKVPLLSLVTVSGTT